MTTLTGNLGEINAPFDQYKICTDSVTLHLHVHGDRFIIKNNDHQIFNYTGPNPKTPENKSILIYDSNEKQFMLKWWSNYETVYYPKNDWCLEKYECDCDREKFEKGLISLGKEELSKIDDNMRISIEYGEGIRILQQEE